MARRIGLEVEIIAETLGAVVEKERMARVGLRPSLQGSIADGVGED